MQQYAFSRGGKCLSTEYINSKTKLKWQCKEGHIWEATPSGYWCPTCGYKRVADALTTTIDFYKKIALDRKGKCLSDDYVEIDGRKKLLFECKKGHQWYANLAGIRNGRWCPKCKHIETGNRSRLSIDVYREMIEKRGGKLLKTDYHRSSDKVTVQCENGHIFYPILSSLKHVKSWCPHCRKGKKGYNIRLTIEDLKKIAERKGGKCLSEVYITLDSRYEWQCKEGHIWEASAGKIKNQGCWCPICSSGISERYCRKFFETIFNKKFPKKHPSWLLSDKGHRMELDGFCEELKLAFEYQGRQHYTDDFYKTKARKKMLRDIQKQDELKKTLCEKNQVILITIPYTVSIDNMQKYIIEKCLERNVILPDNIPEIDYHSFDVYSPKHLAWVKDYAKRRGGECLSDRYHGRDEKLVFRCAKGHIFSTTTHSLKSMKTWCPKCGGRPLITIEDMRELAKKYNGECLSNTYTNLFTKLKWRCINGHIFERNPVDIRHHNTFCPICGKRRAVEKRKLTIEEMNEIAKTHGGECLSKEYINSHTKLKWKCSKGHIWEASPLNIKYANHWCPICTKFHNRRPRKYNRNYKKFLHKHVF